jgi:hypothetical protein
MLYERGVRFSLSFAKLAGILLASCDSEPETNTEELLVRSF